MDGFHALVPDVGVGGVVVVNAERMARIAGIAATIAWITAAQLTVVGSAVEVVVKLPSAFLVTINEGEVAIETPFTRAAHWAQKSAEAS
jgi:hypothetical protein